jgi:AcrR family transcriptional regulator
VVNEHEPSVPRTLRVMWGTPEPPRRGPKPATSLRAIAAAAVELADAEGIAAASLPRVAARLGTGTSSLYRYVESRDDLDAAMLDHAYGPAPQYDGPRFDGADAWRARLRHWALGNRIVLEQHPWILHLSAAEPPLGPNRTAWTEQGLAAFDGAPGNSAENLSALLLVEIFIRGFAQLSIAPPPAPALADDAFAAAPYSRRLAAVLDAASYPRLTEAISDGAFDREQDDLELALDTLLDGIARNRPAP